MQRNWGVKFFVLSVVICGVALLIRWRLANGPDQWGGRGHPRVVVSLPPLACFVRNVAGPNVALACLCTDKGPADYVGTDGDITLIQQADLFLGVGLGVDSALVDALHAKAPKVVFRKVGEDLPAGLESDGDPRVWLGFSRAIVLVERVRDELKKVDPAHGADYDSNADRYIKQLRDLQSKWKKEVETKKDRRFVSLEGPLRHFADSFGLNLVAAHQFDFKESSNSKPMREVIRLCLAVDGPHILTAAPGFERAPAAKTVGKAILDQKVKAALIMIDPIHIRISPAIMALPFWHATLVVIDPLETADSSDLGKDDWYVKKMHDNLERIVKHLR